MMYPFPPRTWIASRATCVAVSAENRIAAAHSRARSPLELQPPETERGDAAAVADADDEDGDEAAPEPSFFASAFAAAE